MNQKSAMLLSCAAAITIMSACSTEPQQSSANVTPSSVSKIINSPQEAIPGSVLVKIKSGNSIEDLSGVLTENSATAERIFASLPDRESQEKSHGLDRWYQVNFEETNSPEVIARALSASDAVEVVEYDHILERYSGSIDSPAIEPAEHLTVTGYNDPYFAKQQWYLYNNGSKSLYGDAVVAGADVDVKDAWRIASGDPSIIVAVVDDGVKYTHPDLEANMWTNTLELYGEEGVDDDGNGYVDDIHGYNFVSNGAVNWLGSYTEGHGTHVAGLVGAVNNNGEGISSIAGGTGNGDGIRIMSCQIFEGSKQTGMASYANAIKYAADNGASILQCSWGDSSGKYKTDDQFERGQSVLKAALDYFIDPGEGKYNSGVLTDGNLVIFSAGNDYEPLPAYPGAYHDYVCVAATSQDNLPAWYTNYGPGVNISAPGGDNKIGGLTMISTLPSELTSNGIGYGYMHGTSQATPLVSSAAALGLSYAKSLGKKFTRNEFISMLLTSVNDIDSRLSGTKVAGSVTLNLDNFKHQMGTGIIDVWALMMEIEGTPSSIVRYGQACEVDLSEYFGGGAADMTFLGISISTADKAALGITSDPTIKDGKMTITCNNLGAGKITISAVGGGTAVGGTSPGGMEISKTISIISRGTASSNGGWL